MIGIVVVNYKNEDLTIKFVNQELSKINSEKVIVIVDNESTSTSSEYLKSSLNAQFEDEALSSSNLYVLRNNDNLGFAKGNNSAIEFLTNYYRCEFFLFINNDIVFKDNNAIDYLICKLNSFDKTISMIGPRVIGLDGCDQSPLYYVSIFRKWFWGLWLKSFFTNSSLNKVFGGEEFNKTEGICYSIMGSCILVRASDFLEVDMFDEKTFLFGEEFILAERLKKKAKMIYYDSSTCVIHYHNQSIGKKFNSSQKLLLQFDSDSYYYRTYKNISLMSLFICKVSLFIRLFISKIMMKNE
ncbi:glycosyltransferase family 2 protein [uncultured Bacteroides sp.]|uniref:glycosyltransferase family 2 protein n=1 Tax=uncultured Bacteroides sp. TaxID=162156 RepID=UPI002AAB06CB|nr:glycosyltransferase family 2 protein [uncultured Bacteroides sp.]